MNAFENIEVRQDGKWTCFYGSDTAKEDVSSKIDTINDNRTGLCDRISNSTILPNVVKGALAAVVAGFSIKAAVIAGAIVFTAAAPPAAIGVFVAAIVIGAVALIALGMISYDAYQERKEMIYEFILPGKVIKNGLFEERYPWSNEIVNDSIVLGGIPLKGKEHGHIEMILGEDLDPSKVAVLSVVEEFEFEAGWLSDPVTKEDWKELGVSHAHVHALDYEPLSEEQIREGVKFMEEQAALGKKVYVHCKSGVGRSATIVAAYLAKHPEVRGVTTQETSQEAMENAIAFINKNRKTSIKEVSRENIIAMLSNEKKV